MTTALPQRTPEQGPQPCALVVNRLVDFVERRQELPSRSLPRLTLVAAEGLAGVPEGPIAEVADGDWQDVPSVRELVERIGEEGGAAAIMLQRRGGWHLVEVEREDGQLILHDIDENDVERILDDDEQIQRWLHDLEFRHRPRQAKAIVVDDNGIPEVPFVKRDRMAVPADRPDGLAGNADVLRTFGRDDLPEDDSEERDRDNRDALHRQQNQLGARFGDSKSQRALELDALEFLTGDADYFVAEFDTRSEQTGRNPLGPVRLLQYNKDAHQEQLGRMVFQYGDPMTAPVVLGIVVEATTDGAALFAQPRKILAQLEAGREAFGDVAAIVLHRHDDPDLAQGGAHPGPIWTSPTQSRWPRSWSEFTRSGNGISRASNS